jgi:hypothetical protein
VILGLMFGLQPPGNLKGSSREDQVNRPKRAARQRRFFRPQNDSAE